MKEPPRKTNVGPSKKQSQQRTDRPPKSPIFNRLAVIGMGLIGSSIARAARAQGAVRSIAATARSAATRRRVAELGLADQVVETNAAAVEGADLVIVCIPVGACGAVAAEIGSHLAPGAIVSDAGSVKAAVVRDMSPHLPATAHFLPAHPVAGTERSGPDAGFAELFVNRWCIITPPPGADPAAVERLKAFWGLLGANVETMSADHHDLVLGITSHLPHLIAYTIVGTASELTELMHSRLGHLASGAFRDFTRIAASDPTMWRDIFLANRDAVLEMLGTFVEDLATLTRAMRSADGETLLHHFTKVRAIRKYIAHADKQLALPRVDADEIKDHWTSQYGPLLAITSHLPHLIAYTIVGTADELSKVTRSEVLQFSAGGFRDFTRIAVSSPTYWRDVLLNNKTSVFEVLGRFNEDLAQLTRAIRRKDGEALFNFFSRARAIRRSIVEINYRAPRLPRELPPEPLRRPYATED